MQENGGLREKMTLLELALAMESYPSAPPSSVAVQCENALRMPLRVQTPEAQTVERPAAHTLAPRLGQAPLP